MKRTHQNFDPDYDKGFKDGLAAFAHWHNGKQQVGTSGTSLAQALRDRQHIWNYLPPKKEEIK